MPGARDAALLVVATAVPPVCSAPTQREHMKTAAGKRGESSTLFSNLLHAMKPLMDEAPDCARALMGHVPGQLRACIIQAGHGQVAKGQGQAIRNASYLNSMHFSGWATERIHNFRLGPLALLFWVFPRPLFLALVFVFRARKSITRNPADRCLLLSPSAEQKHQQCP